jgi:hypothetical protein
MSELLLYLHISTLHKFQKETRLKNDLKVNYYVI